MSSRPTVSRDWATDVNFVDVGQDWDGTPTKINPSSGRRAEGFEPRRKLPATWLNYLFNAIGQWLQWLDDKFATTGIVQIQTDANAVGLTNVGRLYSGASFAPGIDNTGAAQWQVTGVVADDWIALAAQAPLYCQLTGLPRSGDSTAQISEVRVYVTMGATHGTAGDRIQAYLVKKSWNGSAWTYTTIAGPVAAANSTSPQEIVVYATPINVASADDTTDPYYTVIVRSSTSSFATDTVHAALAFTKAVEHKI